MKRWRYYNTQPLKSGVEEIKCMEAATDTFSSTHLHTHTMAPIPKIGHQTQHQRNVNYTLPRRRCAGHLAEEIAVIWLTPPYGLLHCTYARGTPEAEFAADYAGATMGTHSRRMGEKIPDANWPTHR